MPDDVKPPTPPEPPSQREQAISAWLNDLPPMLPSRRDELADHLRCEVAKLPSNALTVEERVMVAAHRLRPSTTPRTLLGSLSMTPSIRLVPLTLGAMTAGHAFGLLANNPEWLIALAWTPWTLLLVFTLVLGVTTACTLVLWPAARRYAAGRGLERAAVFLCLFFVSLAAVILIGTSTAVPTIGESLQIGLYLLTPLVATAALVLQPRSAPRSPIQRRRSLQAG